MSAPRLPSLGQLEGGGLLIIVGVIAVLLYRSGAIRALSKPGALNPGSANNVVYGGVNSIGAAATGDANFTLGGWLYDITHPSAGNGGAPAANTGLGQLVNPQTDNPIYDANDARARGQDGATKVQQDIYDANDARARGLDATGIEQSLLTEDEPDRYGYTFGA